MEQENKIVPPLRFAEKPNDYDPFGSSEQRAAQRALEAGRVTGQIFKWPLTCPGIFGPIET